MIKNKIDAREKALELAVKTYCTEVQVYVENYSDREADEMILHFAAKFEKYLIGRDQLPDF